MDVCNFIKGNEGIEKATQRKLRKCKGNANGMKGIQRECKGTE